MALNKILLSDNLTELTGVKSVVYKEVTNADVNIRPGCVCSASIEVEVYGTQASAVSAGDTVYYYQIDKNNTQTLIGIFTCEPSIETKTSYKFVAYDNAQKLKADFSQWLQANQSNFPMTVYALVSAACTVAGVTLGSSSWGLSTQNVQAFYSDGITCRDIISYAAEIGCCFVRCHTNGSIYFDWYSSNANTIAPSVGTGQYAYKADGLTYANFTTAALDRVAVHPSGEDDVAYIYPTGVTSGNTIHIQNNLLLTGADAAFYNAVAQNVYTVMSALGTYRPMSAILFTRENPFRAGDIVSVTDSQSVSFTSIITGMTVTNSGAVLESTGNETYGEGTGNTQKAITQLASDVVRINKLKVDWADINTAIINYLTANNVTAQNLTIVDENGNVLATYDANGITLGNSGEVHAEIDFNSFQLYDRNGNLYTLIGDARDANGLADVICTQKADGISSFYSIQPSADDPSSIVVSINGTVLTSGYTPHSNYIDFSPRPSAGDIIVATYKTSSPFYQYLFGTLKSGTELGYYSLASGLNATSSGYLSSSIGGLGNKATGEESAVLGGRQNVANDNCSAVIGGNTNTARASDAVVAGGNLNYASGGSSFVGGGYQNNANGDCSAVLGGISNDATGSQSGILAGQQNDASGLWSVTLGGNNIEANHESQVVFGEYNILDPSTAASTARGNYIEIVGNGTSISERSNARTLDWVGNEKLSGYINVRTGLIQIGTTPSSGLYPSAFISRDANDVIYGRLSGTYLPSGRLGINVGSERIINGTTVYNWLGLLIDNNGNPIVTVSASADVAWRSALGIGTSGAFPITIAQGGTGSTGTSSDESGANLFTPASGFSISEAYSYSWGKVAMINIAVTKTTAVTSQTFLTLGTITANKRPKAVICASSTDTAVINAYVLSSGSVNVNVSSWGANTTKRIMAVYLLA